MTHWLQDALMILGASPLLVITAVPGAIAQETSLMEAEINPTQTGLEILLETNESPAFETTTSGNTLIITLPDTQLEPQQRQNPTPDLELVEIRPLSQGTEIRVVGLTELPEVTVNPSPQGLQFQITTTAPIELIVTATRTEQASPSVPRSVTVIDRETIEQQTTLSRDLGDTLTQLVPGYGFSNQTATDFSQTLRGRSPVLLIDGVPITENRGYGRDLRSIDPEAIERIEVVRGASAIYGSQGAGGIINIITRTPSEEAFTASVELGFSSSLVNVNEESFGHFTSYGLSGSDGELDYRFNLAWEDTGAFFDSDGDRIALARSLEDSDNINILGKIGTDFAENQRFQLTVNHFQAETDKDHLPRENPEPGLQKAVAEEVGEIEYQGGEAPGNENTVVTLDYRHDDFLNSELQGQFYYQDFFLAFPGGPFGSVIAQTQGDSRKLGGRVQLNTPLSEQANLLWGVDYVDEETAGPIVIFDSKVFNESEGRIFDAIEQTFDIPPYNLENLGLFAQADWQINSNWSLNGGVRYDNIGFEVDDFTSFRTGVSASGGDLSFDDVTFNVGTVVSLSEETSLFANFAQGFSVPSFGFILRSPAPGFSVSLFDLTEPIQVNNYEIGFRGNWSTLQMSLAGYLSTSELGASFVQNPDGLLEVTRSPEEIYGIEATIDFQPSGNWELGGTFTWQEGENTETDEALSSRRIPPVKLTAYVENQTTSQWRNRLQLVYAGDRDRAFEDDIDRVAVEGYLSVDYISQITFGAGELQIGVENLLNADYFPIGGQLIAPFVESSLNQARGRVINVQYQLEW